MSKPCDYWQLVQVGSAGQIRQQVLEAAEVFFSEKFSEYVTLAKVPDREIQRQLLYEVRQGTAQARQAELCLRCYISQALLKSCRSLVRRFGEQFNLTLEALLPLALGDFGFNQASANATFVSITDQVLSSFDPNRSGLATWCDRVLKSNREIKQVLAELGIELKSNWLILNRATVGKVRRVLNAFEQTEREIEEAIELLQAFHQVYRAEILAHRSQKGGKYPPPAPQLLAQMSRQLTLLQEPSPEVVFSKLEQLATFLRQYSPPPAKSPLPADSPESSANNELQELLDQYCIPCLVKAFQVVLERRLAGFSPRELKRGKDKKFLKALRLFHCEGKSLGQIAPEINLTDQPAVSRFLKLKSFREDVRIETIKFLKHSVLELAQAFRSPEALKQLDSQVTTYLNRYLTNLIKAAEKGGYDSKSPSSQTDNLFSQTLCNLLEHWS